MKITIMLFIALQLLSIENVFAVNCAKSLELFTQYKNVEIINSCERYLRESNNNYDLYLYYKTLLRLGKVEESKTLFENLQKLRGNQIKLVVQHEKLKRAIKTNNITDIARQIIQQPKGLKVKGIRESVKNVILGTQITRNIDLKALKLVIESALLKQESSQLIKYILKMNPPEIARLTPTLRKLWKTVDIKKISINEQKHLKRVILVSKSEALDWNQHLTKQLKYRNSNYILQIIRSWRQGVIKLDLPEKSLQRFYIKSKIQKRHFSKLLLELRDKDGWLRFLPEERSKLEFNLLVKKGDIEEAIRRMEAEKNVLNRDIFSNMVFQIAEYYFERRQYSKSAHYYPIYLQRGTSAEGVELAQWRLLMSLIETGDNKRTKYVFQWAGKHKFVNSENGARFCFWKVKLEFDDGLGYKGCYQMFPNTFYGLRSLFKKRPETDIRQQKFAKDNKGLNKVKSQLPAGLIYGMEVLYVTGEKDLADYLILERRRREPDPHYVFEMSNTLIRYQRYNLFLRLLNSYDFSKLLEIEGSEDRVKSFYYPLAFQNEVKLNSKKYQVPELLVYSVMREESRFEPAVESPAGATGLLQLMPETAKYIGKILKMSIKKENLIDPGINLQLGIAYLKRLLKRYKGNHYYTLAAYNGGPTNVRKWRKRTKVKDEDHFLESISFTETQRYVKKVLRSYYKYQLLYGKTI